jgi:hypothetical protein
MFQLQDSIRPIVPLQIIEKISTDESMPEYLQFIGFQTSRPEVKDVAAVVICGIEFYFVERGVFTRQVYAGPIA